ncbi:MAG: hypothetical protein AB7T49_14440 [Oligoflexales bacterium]
MKMLFLSLLALSTNATCNTSIYAVAGSGGFTCGQACADAREEVLRELDSQCDSSLSDIQFSQGSCDEFEYTVSCSESASAACISR